MGWRESGPDAVPPHPEEKRVAMIKSCLSLLVLLMMLTGCSGVPKGIEPVRNFDAERYTGTWYEIARLDHSFERGMTHVTATYALREDGTIEVLNRGYDAGKGRWREADAVARFRGEKDVASLSVTFLWPFSGGYHVFALDHEGYKWALVCGPTRDYFWILARKPSVPDPLLADLIEKANENGFAVKELIWVEQANPPEG